MYFDDITENTEKIEQIENPERQKTCSKREQAETTGIHKLVFEQKYDQI